MERKGRKEERRKGGKNGKKERRRRGGEKERIGIPQTKFKILVFQVK